MEYELLKAEEVARRLGVSKPSVNRLARDGYLTRTNWNKFPWPKTLDEFKTYQNGKSRNAPIISQMEGKTVLETTPFLDIPENEIPKVDLPPEQTLYEQRKKDLETMSLGQKILEGLKRQIDGTENTAYNWARALNEHVKARQSMLDLLEQEGKTLKYSDVETWLMNVSRQNRDQWLNWPQRVATEMAEELGIDSRMMNDILMRHVRENLERAANFPEHFGGAGNAKQSS